MARFYGEIYGQAKTPATRIGGAISGLSGHLRGWDVGVEIWCHTVNDEDIIEVWETGGSNSPSTRKKIATLTNRR